jgi:arylsulfatase A-like enzyme
MRLARLMLLLLPILAEGSFWGTRSKARAAEPARPNIILLVTDDQRFDAVGALGNPVVKTPHLDALADEGMIFRQMFCTTSICATSRTTILTGQYESRHGVRDFRTTLSEAAFGQTFPALLHGAGYYVGFVGKWGLGGPLPRDRYDTFAGFSGQGRYFAPDGSHLTHKLGDSVLEVLDACPEDRPFCLQVSFKAAHCQDGDPWPFQPDPRYNELYQDVTIPLAPTANEAAFEALPEFLRTSEARHRWHIRFATPALYQKSVKDYYRLITGVDDVVGRIVKSLADSGRADNTVILFTSDNGFYLGEHGLAGKWFMHEESLRLPLIIHDPRQREKVSAHETDAIALTTDLAPTILDLAGVEVPGTMQGHSLAPVLSGGDAPRRKDFFYEHHFEHPRIPASEGVRTVKWKYVRYIDRDPPYEQLFDLANDSGETTNLAQDPNYAEPLSTLRERWAELREAVK